MTDRPLDSHITALAAAAAGVRVSLARHAASPMILRANVTADELVEIVSQSDKMLDMVLSVAGGTDLRNQVRLIVAETIFASRLDDDIDPLAVSYNGWRTEGDTISRTVFRDADDGAVPETPFSVVFLAGSVSVSRVDYAPEPDDDVAFAM